MLEAERGTYGDKVKPGEAECSADIIIAAMPEPQPDAEYQAAVEKILADYTDWRPNKGIFPTILPVHGPCCMCQTCGRYHDDCVCQHNEIEALLAATKGERQ